jgi:hypothetical protein
MKTNFRELRIYDLFPVLTIFSYFWRLNYASYQSLPNYKDNNYCAYGDKKQEKFSIDGIECSLCPVVMPVGIRAGLMERLCSSP